MKNDNDNNPHNIPLLYGCETEACFGSVAVFENGTWGTCSTCGNMQMCDDISAPITAWEIQQYGGKITTGFCDYCEADTAVTIEGWCEECSN